MNMPTERLERRILTGLAGTPQVLLGVALPVLFVAVILTADVLEGPKTAYVGLLASAPMLAAIFGSMRMVVFSAGITWVAAFVFGRVASDGNVPAQNVRLVIIAIISLVAIASAWVRLLRQQRYADALVRTAEAESLERAALLDMLTGLLNRREFFAASDRSRTAAAALAVIDIDGLKRINDEYGHPAGDAFIAAVAKRLKRQFRDGDLVARWGGDEFLIRIDAPAEEAVATLRRAIDAVAANPVVIDDQQLPVSLSAGIARWAPGESFDEAYRFADARMYGVKHHGHAIGLADG